MENTTELFKTRAVVKGNKHSYKMTVEESNEKTTDCIYFDKGQNIHRAVYKLTNWKSLTIRRVGICQSIFIEFTIV